MSTLSQIGICGNINTQLTRTDAKNSSQILQRLKTGLLTTKIMKFQVTDQIMRLSINLTDYNDAKVINMTNVGIWMSVRSNQTLSLTAEDFALSYPRNKFLEATFWIIGVLLIAFTLLVVVKKCCSPIDEQSDYKNLFVGEDEVTRTISSKAAAP